MATQTTSTLLAGTLQGDTLGPFFFIICLDCVLRMSIDKMKDNSFNLAKVRSRRYPKQTITDDIALLENAPTQAETLLHSLERAVAGIGLYINAGKNGYMCFIQRGDISTLNGRSLKLVDKFTYLRWSISKTENDIDTRLAKAWTANDRIWSYESHTWPIK